MRPSYFVWGSCFAGLLLVATPPPAMSTNLKVNGARDFAQAASTSSNATSVAIPGPLRSFLRMSGISVEIPPQNVLPELAQSVLLQGYESGSPTEFLILLRRYVVQAEELNSMATMTRGEIRVNGCKDWGPLLQILGYKVQGDCGKATMALITYDPERAFLTVNSGFPLVDLEQALQRDVPFTYPYRGTAVPVIFSVPDWTGLRTQKPQDSKDVLGMLLYQSDVARLYWGLSRIEAETRLAMKNEIGLEKLLHLAPVLDLYGRQICIRQGRVVVPGGMKAEKNWHQLVGANPGTPKEFIQELLTKDHGWLAAYYDAMARASLSQQEHFAEGQRLKRYYAAFRSPGTTGLGESAVRLAYRPAPGLLALVAQMRWDEQGNPYVPGDLDAWTEVLRPISVSKLMLNLNRHLETGGAERLAEKMFVFSRLETEGSPLEAYLCLGELDRRRGASRRLSSSAVELLGKKYADFSDQYLIFLEFPELSEDSMARFLSTAEALGKIPDHTVRGNAMGIFQANIGLWQIAGRQRQIERSQLNASWQAVIKPFVGVTTDRHLVAAGRSSTEQVFRAATGKTNVTQEGLIELLAGPHQMSAEGQKIHQEMAEKIRTVMQDQRLVSIDTLYALDDGLKDEDQLSKNRSKMVALAGQLREFEMPQPIFTNSERVEWAEGTYNNRHTEIQMKTDLAKVIQSNPTPKQLEGARGRLATFLRDTLVGMNYAYYEPPGSQMLHNNPLLVRSHDFSGDTVMGVHRLWQAPQLYGAGSPAGGGAHLIGSLADLPYTLAAAEQDFIAPDHVQALIWQVFVPQLLSNASVPRWWNVNRDELHAVALYQRAGEELMAAAAKDEKLRGEVLSVFSDRLFPDQLAGLEQGLREGEGSQLVVGISPADCFHLTAAFRQKYAADLDAASPAARELNALHQAKPDKLDANRLSRDFGVVHPVFEQTYGLDLVSMRPFPALEGKFARLMSECWESGNLYWARLADEKGYEPVLLNRVVPELTRRMVERIYANDLEDWAAALRAMYEAGAEFREGKLAMEAESAVSGN